ncbi:MAG: hypothetical protein HZB39_14590 [Planctomycetes bacterium]|nr:hypothetical protein [Planctomycetota bacterium]
MDPTAPRLGMLMNPRTTRFLVYPTAAALAGVLGWIAFGYEAEADFGTLIQSASIHAELAASIPADSPKPKGLELRNKLIQDAYGWLERADRVSPNSPEGCQLRAFLAMTEGRPLDAAMLYRKCRGLANCENAQYGPLAMHEAKALSNAGHFEDALKVLADSAADVAVEQRPERDLLTARILWRGGRVDQAVAAVKSVIETGAEGSSVCREGAALLEAMGEYGPSESAWRKSETVDELERYHVARLKARAGKVEEARENLERAVGSGNPEVLRRMAQDDELWAAAIGEQRLQELSGAVSGTPASAGR